MREILHEEHKEVNYKLAGIIGDMAMWGWMEKDRTRQGRVEWNGAE